MRSNVSSDWSVPVKNRSRALAFYSAVLCRDLHEDDAVPLFEVREQADGVVAGLDVEGDLDGALERVWSNGGQILEPELDALAMGPCALVMDTEGNCIALYVRT